MQQQAIIAARLDRLPITRTHMAALTTLAFVFLFELADLNTFAYAAPALTHHLGFGVPDIALVTSACFLGMGIGAIYGGRISDAIGRRHALLYSTALFSIASIVNALGQDVPTFAAYRFLTGLGLGTMVVAATTYISETMPAHKRGRMQSAVMAIGLAGIPVMSFTARAIVPLAHDAWRWVFVLGGLAILSLPALIALPESPRWLAHRGRDDAAEASVARFERHAGHLPAIDPSSIPPLKAQPRAGYWELFSRKIGPTTAFLSVVQIAASLGFYGFAAWVPTLLADHGFSLAKSLEFSALTTIGAIPGALLAWPITDRFGRKIPLVIVTLAAAVSGLLYGTTFNPVAIVVFGFCVNLLLQTYATLIYTYSPEVFPTRLRTTGNGFAYGLGRLANIFGPGLVAVIYSSLGYQAVFVYIGACWLVVALTIAVFGPRTGKASIEADTGEANRTPATSDSAAADAPA